MLDPIASFPWPGAFVTFQIAFTELFLLSMLLLSIGRKSGWRSTAIGVALGTGIVLIMGLVLQALNTFLTAAAAVWVSPALLLAFGIYLFFGFAHGLGVEAMDRDGSPSKLRRRTGLHVVGAAAAAWAIATEGLEVLVVWFGVALRQGNLVASTGVIVACAVMPAVIYGFHRSGVARAIPAYLLDGFAAFTVTSYGCYFLFEAARHFGY